MKKKPLNCKSYGHIGHLIGSRLGSGDHHINDGQNRIATQKLPNSHYKVIVQEKLDGSNIGVALKDKILYPLTRSGYVAISSPYKQHKLFAQWVYKNEDRFRTVLNDGERICGEWLLQAHGTRYKLKHEPFVAFDIFNKDNKRLVYSEFESRIISLFKVVASG